MRKILAAILSFLFPLAAMCAGIGEWTSYLSYHNVTDNLPVGKEIYTLCDGNLFVYDTETTEVRMLSKLTGLNDKAIQHIAYSSTQGIVCLVYSNGNIDLIDRKGNIFNIPHLKNANDGTLVINSITADGDNLLLAVNDGFVYIDLANREIKNYCRLGVNVTCATIFDGRIYLSASDEIRTCSLESNYSDPAQWSTFLKARVKTFLPFSGHLYAMATSLSSAGSLAAGLWLFSPAEEAAMPSYVRVSSTNFTTAYANDSYAVFTTSKAVRVYSASDLATASQEFSFESTWTQLTRDASGTFWGACGMEGLLSYRESAGELVPGGEKLGNYGPRRDLCYYMQYVGDRLLVAGGRLDPYGILHYPGTVACYENGEWTTFQEDGISDITLVPYRDITRVVQDPADPNHHFASAGGTGVYEYRDFQFVKQYSCTNSPLLSAVSDANKARYVRVDGVNFDAYGNLWMVNNSMTDSVVRVMKPDGSWKAFYFDGLKKAPTCEKTMFDSKGRLWIASRRTVSFHVAGLLAFDYNGTVDNTSDDISRYRTAVTNQDGTSYTLGGVYAMAEDMDGAIWIGTASGLFVISDPDEWFDNDFHITQIKVPRNDGTNYADYLLSETAVTAIAVDGANRKWIGTESNGIYLVSPDGIETIYHFTTENSPLFSDNIYSIAPNTTTGEVMIGTDEGLISFQSEATAPASELKESNIKIYPNPVRPEHNGNIVLSGLTADADVKVTTVNGQVVASGTSVGGTFVWDGRNLRGQRVASGVYYFMIATSNGKTGIVGSVVVI